MEQNLDLQNDPVFDKVSELTRLDQEIADRTVTKFLDILKDELENSEDYGLKHGFIALSKTMIFLSQSLCENEEEFNAELHAAQNVAINRMVPAILPKIEEGEIVEEGYDLENLSIRRIMMSIGTAIDYVFWRNEISKYSETREELEKQEQEFEQ